MPRYSPLKKRQIRRGRLTWLQQLCKQGRTGDAETFARRFGMLDDWNRILRGDTLDLSEASLGGAGVSEGASREHRDIFPPSGNFSELPPKQLGAGSLKADVPCADGQEGGGIRLKDGFESVGRIDRPPLTAREFSGDGGVVKPKEEVKAKVVGDGGVGVGGEVGGAGGAADVVRDGGREGCSLWPLEVWAVAGGACRNRWLWEVMLEDGSGRWSVVGNVDKLLSPLKRGDRVRVRRTWFSGDGRDAEYEVIGFRDTEPSGAVAAPVLPIVVGVAETASRCEAVEKPNPVGDGVNVEPIVEAPVMAAVAPAPSQEDYLEKARREAYEWALRMSGGGTA